MKDQNNKTNGMNVAMLWTNDKDTATCVVQLQDDVIDVKFDGIGLDDSGPFLVSDEGQVIRIGEMDRETFHEALDFPNLRLHLLDEAGMSVKEYSIDAVRPEPSSAFGA